MGHNHIKFVRNFFLLFFLFIGVHVHASPEYLRYVDEIVNSFAKEMKKEYGLHCYGSGGSMPKDVEKIDVMFVTCRKVSLEKARAMEVKAVQKLLNKINSHEKIRPYLREYPFKSDRVKVCLSFHNRNDRRHLDGSIVYVSLIKNTIFYEAAKIIIEEPAPLRYINDKNELVEEMIGGGPEETLVLLHEEPFEEAVKIVQSTQPRD